MKNRSFFTGILSIILAAGLLVTGCDQSEKNNPVTVTYDANGGSGTVPDLQTVNAGSSIIVAEQGGLTHPGKTFNDWNTSTNGSGTPYTAGSSVTVNDDITLYAQWNETDPDETDPDNNTTPDNPDPVNDITAAELVSQIKAGWNLGNTLDAYNLSWLPANPTVNQLETAWISHRTTTANIAALKNAGFNAIRIPVSWTKAADSNYTIRADWMARVTEIVNYAASNDMYIILNTHHDENVFRFMNSNAEASKQAFKRIWEQIADNFKNHDEKLIFEGLNEPRTPGSSAEWNGGTAEERANLNAHYQIFVDTVRASGGNNDKRMLIINAYAASSSAIAMNALTLPTDTVANKLIVSFHAYEPYNFALNTGNGLTAAWDRTKSSDTNPITQPIDRYYNKFTANGIPVIIGEFGAMNRNNEAVRAQWARYYVDYARSKGMPCFWWDNGVVSGNGELFGLLNRQNNTFTYPSIVAALTGVQ